MTIGGHCGTSIVEVFVDEFGDRGFGPAASRLFAMTALIVPQESVRHMRSVAIGLRGIINTPKPLHWVDHFTPKQGHRWRRTVAADLLSSIPGAMLVHVLADKETLTAGTAIRSDKDMFYNYVTRLLLERVGAAARNWSGGARRARVRMGSVKNQDHDETLSYLTILHSRGELPESLIMPISWHGPAEFDGLQLADLAMGMFSAACRCEVGTTTDAEYLVKQSGLIRRSPEGAVLGWGIKVYGDHSILTGQGWWEDLADEPSP